MMLGLPTCRFGWAKPDMRSAGVNRAHPTASRGRSGGWTNWAPWRAAVTRSWSVRRNLDSEKGVRLQVEGLNGVKDLYLLTADSLDSKDLRLNGVILRDDQGALPDLSAQSIGNGPADLPPRSMAFVVFPDANASACQ